MMHHLEGHNCEGPEGKIDLLDTRSFWGRQKVGFCCQVRVSKVLTALPGGLVDVHNFSWVLYSIPTGWISWEWLRQESRLFLKPTVQLITPWLLSAVPC